ncbi:hypothetical protein Y1Q_0018927 [Alligator mississippiensis]|uniref:Uncharacterized protein n=1 Tax=Alligator mississippiensis TaxID=8496 RepID=A0A151M374_ALLMI|nr:hypothetical protein Y1Q_0018927 [Alligator mississippiensis]
MFLCRGPANCGPAITADSGRNFQVEDRSSVIVYSKRTHTGTHSFSTTNLQLSSEELICSKMTLLASSFPA